MVVGSSSEELLAPLALTMISVSLPLAVGVGVGSSSAVSLLVPLSTSSATVVVLVLVLVVVKWVEEEAGMSPDAAPETLSSSRVVVVWAKAILKQQDRSRARSTRAKSGRDLTILKLHMWL